MSWEVFQNWMRDWGFWLGIVGFITLIISTIINRKVGGASLLNYYPNFKIDFIIGDNERTGWSHQLILWRLNDKKVRNCKLYYATPRTDGFKEVNIPRGIKNDINEGDKTTIDLSNIGLRLTLADAPVIWKFGYHLHSCWLYTSECFDWEKNGWVPSDWDELYAGGLLKLFIGPFIKKENKQIKIWKKENKKEEKKRKRRIVS